jgi:hypothetical protein
MLLLSAYSVWEAAHATGPNHAATELVGRGRATLLGLLMLGLAVPTPPGVANDGV